MTIITPLQKEFAELMVSVLDEPSAEQRYKLALDAISRWSVMDFPEKAGYMGTIATVALNPVKFMSAQERFILALGKLEGKA
ncbi:hypothetical protein [Ralstonia phage phiRSL1]|uniref:Uncharacterized protein n=1 Tax=Ralstonia phage phiRSL1 TaxID=1980924 RepID=B2ZXU9_9CAUD|nr:hypothetical protein RSL1_ORF079 [Ralstonia phage phiRSL1]BAG41525.1 hypothetical protein [Ralstonia phage phiRSL1]